MPGVVGHIRIRNPNTPPSAGNIDPVLGEAEDRAVLNAQRLAAQKLDSVESRSNTVDAEIP